MSIKLMSVCWEKQFENRSDREVMLALCDNANEDGICWPSRGLVAWKTDLSEPTLKKVYKRLKDLGALEVVAHAEGGRGRVPILRVDPRVLPDKPARERGEPTYPLSAKGGNSLTHKGGNSLTPEPSIEPSVKPSTDVEGKILSTKRQKKEWADASTGEKQAYLVAWLHERVDERGQPVPSPAYKERLSGELRNALNEGRDRGVLFEALFHITNRWEHTKLSLWQALNDIDARKRRQQMKVVDTPSEWKEPEPFYDENGQAWINTPRGKRRFVNADR